MLYLLFVYFGFAHMTYSAALQHGTSSSTGYRSILQHNLLSDGIFNIHLELAEQKWHRQEQQRGCSALADCSIGKAPKHWHLTCHIAANSWGDSHLTMLWV